MKKLIKVNGILFIFLMACFSIGLAQESTTTQGREYQAQELQRRDYTEMESSKTLQFENESKQAEVEIHVSDEFNLLLIEVHGSFEKGETLIELFDPNGIKKGYFIIKTETNISKGKNTTIMEMVNGKLEKHYRDPIKGNWMIRISPINAVGYININSTVIYHPRMNVLEMDQIKDDIK